MEVRKIPSQALSLSGSTKLEFNGANAKTAKFRMVARSNEPVDNPWYDFPIIHDFAGMKTTKKRLTIDYDHDKTIGYANHWSTADNQLTAEGVIHSYRDGDMAQEVIYWAKGDSEADPPVDPLEYEASITYSDAVVEKIPEGFSTVVNGKLFNGEIGVVREWSLRGIAVTPYGMDRFTKTEMHADKMADVKVFTMNAASSVKTISENKAPIEDITMSADTAAKTESVVESPVEDKKMETEDKPEVVETKDSPTVEVLQQQTELQTETQAPSQGELFLQKFGDSLGGKWFAQGKTLEQATQLFIGSLKAENAELKQRMQALRGAESPVSFSASDDDRKSNHPANVGELSHLTDTQKAFTNEFELPTTKTK